MGATNTGWGSNIQQGTGGGGSKKGHGGQTASAPPTVSAPPVAQNPGQQLSMAEQQFANSPWGPWQSTANPIAQGPQAQYLAEGGTASESSEGTNADLAQWLFGSSGNEGTT